MTAVLTVDGTDVTASLMFSSLTIKLNTIDFALKDSTGFYVAGRTIVFTDTANSISWTGGVASQIITEATEVGGHLVNAITGVNATVASAATAPFDLADAAVAGLFQLEDGSGNIILEDGSGAYLTEGSSFGYANISYQQTVNLDASTTATIRLTTFTSGLWPGQTVNVLWADLYGGTLPLVITEVTITYPANATQPFYFIQMGSQPMPYGTYIHNQ